MKNKLTVLLLFLFICLLIPNIKGVNYGDIDTVVNRYIFDTDTGGSPAMVRINNSEYYLIAYSAYSGDGWVVTTKVDNDTGIITNSNISSFEFDDTNGGYCDIIQINNTNVYAIAFRDTTKTAVTTIRVYENNGTIHPAILDTQLLTYIGSYQKITNLPDTNIFAIVHQEDTTNDGWIETVTIDNTGSISAVNDAIEFDDNYGVTPIVYSLDIDTVAIVYRGVSLDGFIVTYNISSTGDIENTNTSWYEYDGGNGVNPYIRHIANDIYAIAYSGSGNDGIIATVSISDNGVIANSIIDSLKYDSTNSYYEYIFTIHDASLYTNGVYGVTWYDGATYDGFMATMNISNTGIIGDAVIDTYEWEPISDNWTAPVIHVNKSYYYIAYMGHPGRTLALNNGSSCVIEITTNWGIPTITNPEPANNTIDEILQPSCSVTLNDGGDGDKMTLDWYENSTGVWVWRQTNSSCGNGDYSYNFLQANTGNTKYWWRVYVNDTLHNVSDTFCFTTAINNTLPFGNATYPLNNSVNIPVYFTQFYIELNDSNGDIMDYSAELLIEGCDVIYYPDSSVGNGTYGLIFNADFCCPLNYNTVYHWHLNITDGIGWTNQTFNFRTISEAPTQTNEDYNISVIWNVTINDDSGSFNWTITCNNSQVETMNLDTNGSKNITLYNIIQGVTYTLWVNVTDGVSWTNDTYTFSLDSGSSSVCIIDNNSRGPFVAVGSLGMFGIVLWLLERRKKKR